MGPIQVPTIQNYSLSSFVCLFLLVVRGGNLSEIPDKSETPGGMRCKRAEKTDVIIGVLKRKVFTCGKIVVP